MKLVYLLMFSLLLFPFVRASSDKSPVFKLNFESHASKKYTANNYLSDIERFFNTCDSVLGYITTYEFIDEDEYAKDRDDISKSVRDLSKRCRLLIRKSSEYRHNQVASKLKEMGDQLRLAHENFTAPRFKLDRVRYPEHGYDVNNIHSEVEHFFYRYLGFRDLIESLSLDNYQQDMQLIFKDFNWIFEQSTSILKKCIDRGINQYTRRFSLVLEYLTLKRDEIGKNVANIIDGFLTSDTGLILPDSSGFESSRTFTEAENLANIKVKEIADYRIDFVRYREKVKEKEAVEQKLNLSLIDQKRNLEKVSSGYDDFWAKGKRLQNACKSARGLRALRSTLYSIASCNRHIRIEMEKINKELVREDLI